MSYEYYRYCANPPINFFPRALKDLFKEEKTTVNGVETIDKKCELKDILSTYEDGNNYTLAEKKFKKIENRIYVDLGELDTNTNEYTVTKKVCVGFLAKHDDTYDFMKAATQYYALLLKCETDNNAFSSYLICEDQNNSKDPSKPISINLNNSPYKIKELSIVVKYSATNIPDNAKLKIYATYSNISGWSHTFTLDIYRNTENSLDGFKQSSGKDTDFFVLPRVNPSENQKECIKQLQIINNQVFARNASLKDFQFVEEAGEILKTVTKDDGTTTIVRIDQKMEENARKSLSAFKYDSESDTGCKSGNRIGKLKTEYLYNFSNYGQQKELIKYLQSEYFNSADTLSGRIYDRNFLFGNYSDIDPDSNIEGIVNLYRNVVIPFINGIIQEALRYVNFPTRWFSCPKHNPNYKRGQFTTSDSNKRLYSSIKTDGTAGTVYLLSGLTEYANNYSVFNNCLPAGTIVTFKKGADKFADKLSEYCYEIESIQFPNGSSPTINEPHLWIELSFKDKQSCDDSGSIENYCDYDSTGNYTNNGVPYYISEGIAKTGGKHTYSDFISMSTASNINWYSYNKYPSMYNSFNTRDLNDPNAQKTEGVGLDCSGLVINSICDCINTSHKLSITEKTREDGISVTDIKENLVGAVDMNIYDSDNSLMQKGDFVLSEIHIESVDAWARHITICNSGSINNNFMNTNITKTSLTNADFEVIHNYGAIDSADENYIYKNLSEINTADRIKSGCYMKTLQGPYNNTGIKLMNNSSTSVINIADQKIITIGRIFLWN